MTLKFKRFIISYQEHLLQNMTGAKLYLCEINCLFDKKTSYIDGPTIIRLTM